MLENDNDIIKEVDVFLSKQFVNLLYLLQYPIRQSGLPYNKVSFMEARIKPKQQFEITFALNTVCQNYDTNTGIQWATNVDGKDSISSNNYYKSDKMDLQILSSSNVDVNNGKYCIACLRNSELHFIPLDAFYQLRPNLSYMDKIDALKLKNKKTDKVDDTLISLMPRYAPKENEEEKSKRLASYEFFCNNLDDEKWISIKNRSILNEDHSNLKIDLLLSKRNIMNTVSDFNMAKNEYLDQLIPSKTIEAKLHPSLPCNVVSMTDLKLKSVSDQVKILLECAKVMRFDKLISFLPKDCDIASILRYLQQVAMLVQGCWVYKSELLYSCNNSETLCRVRDFVLWTFTNYKFITRKDMANIAKLPAEDEKELLTKIAKRRLHSRDWEFIMSEDFSFISQNTDVVQRQIRLWEKRHLQILAFINDKKSNLKPSANNNGDLVSDNNIDME